MDRSLRVVVGPVVLCALTAPLFAQSPGGSAPDRGAPGAERTVPAPDPHAGMVWVEGGSFTMGSASEHAWPAERPEHPVRVRGLWVDRTEVTNTQFAAFVEATGYVTVAERPVDWNELQKRVPPGTPKPPDEMLKPGSLVFSVVTQEGDPWWSWVHGADWRHPEGPGSSIEGRMDHPVVQVAFEDAMAYAKWAGKRLPTEAEWEHAARGGLDHAEYVWGDQPASDTDEKHRANIWQGTFPTKNTEADGYLRTAPVGTFAPNGYGLVDTAGNVWEWTADWYRVDQNERVAASAGVDSTGRAREAVDPPGPSQGWNPNKPHELERTIKGGSFLCHASYCESYRPSARLGGATDTGTSHIGFRCVMDGARDDRSGAEASDGRGAR